jgi:carbonic anhydrase
LSLNRSSHAHDLSYPAPSGPVLLLSCMDPRLLDDTVEFMNHDNLENRYDHLVLAGASLGALGGCLKKYDHWRKCFFDHLGAACELHNIQEIYLLEHRNCGAYHKVFKVVPEFGDTPEEFEAEAACHRKYALMLEEEIQVWAKKAKRKLRIRAFLMDLRGTVSLLTDP